MRVLAKAEEAQSDSREYDETDRQHNREANKMARAEEQLKWWVVSPVVLLHAVFVLNMSWLKKEDHVSGVTGTVKVEMLYNS